MTSPFNQADGNAKVGWQSQYTHVDTITLPGDVQLTVEQDASPKTRYETGVRNLEHGNSGEARRLIWEAMMRGHMSSEVLFNWLVAMLSGRTVRQFSAEEIDQLRRYQSWCAEKVDDPWADGVRLIYQLLNSVLQPQGNMPRPKTATSLLDGEFDGLGKEQRDKLLQLDLFLSGPRRDEKWRDKLEHARSGQYSGDRLDRVWKFFHPVPAEVVIPSPPEGVPVSGRRWMRVSAVVFAMLAGYVGLELLGQGATLALLAYVVGLTGAIIAAATGPKLRSRTEHRPASQAEAPPHGELAKELTARVDKLFQRSFEKYEPVEITRRLWQEAAVGARQLRRDEIIGICLANGFSADQVAWLIRHEVWQLNQRWRDGTLQIPQQPSPRRGAEAIRRAGLVIMSLGFVLAVIAAPGHALGFAIVLASSVWAWRCWLRVSLERLRRAAETVEKAERDRRQAGIDEAYRRWNAKMKDRPTDAEMAAWLEHDRTVLLGMALDHCSLSRSRVIAHGFLEVPLPGARRSQVHGGLPRYQKYQIQMFLLTEDGFRLVRANLNFLTGSLVVRSRTSRGYDSITAVHVEPDRHGGQNFEVRLAHDDPIKVRVRGSGTSAAGDEQDENPQTVAEAEEVVDDAMSMDAASVDNILHLLDNVAADGRKWLQEHNWATAWTR